MELEFRHLRVVRAVADAGTLTAAAAGLRMTQPSVTEALQRAERILGGPLFRRGAHGATPTPLGEVVTAHARAVLEALDRFGAAAGRTSPGAVRFGCTPSMLLASLSALVPEVLGAEAEVRTELDGVAHLELLADSRLEGALLAEFPEREYPLPDGVRRVAVAVEPMFVGLGDRHRLARCTEIDLADLAGETWGAASTARDHFGDHLAQACRRAGFDPDIRIMDATEALQAAEMGRAVLPVMPGSRARSGMAVVPLAGAPVRMATTLFRRAGGVLGPADAERLWAGLVEAQHQVVQRPPVYRAWLHRHPEWTTTPSRPVPRHDPLARG
ncbi:LysR family transcriptional regulator [Actinosynnema sp. NPDC050436]|uniref:LysR family transcriptional regulator n=1 Tax=Actinosynnema sp. NPDC050436 TaxID=3155659 RepID=UPI003403D2BE